MGRNKKYKREEALEKALKTFWDHGYEQTTSRMLGENMGLNQNTIFKEFESKDALFIEALGQYQKLNEEIILAPILQSNGEIEAVRTFFENFISAVKSGQSPNGCLFANTAVEFGATEVEDSQMNDFHKKIHKKLDIYYRFLHQAFYNLLDKAQKKGNLSSDVNLNQLSNYLVGCTEGLTVIVKVLDEASLKDFTDTVIENLR